MPILTRRRTTPQARPPWLLSTIACGVIGLCGGCEKDDVETFSVPKEAPAPQPTTAPVAAQPLVDIGPMAWDVPDGWREVENRNSMRYATLEAGEGEDTLAVAVSSLMGTGGGIVANINRWRGQIGLGPESQETLAADSIPVESTSGVQGIIVDLIGPAAPGAEADAQRMLAAIFPAPTKTWFIKATATSQLIETHRSGFIDMCNSVRFDASAVGTEPPPVLPLPEATDIGVDWSEIPSGWTRDAEPAPMSVASFTIDSDEQSARLTVTPLGGGQSMLMNVNRWRGQIGLEPVPDLDAASPESITVDGLAGTLVDAVGENGHIMAVMFERGSDTWFFKLTGPDPLVASQLEAFKTFVTSTRFGGTDE